MKDHQITYSKSCKKNSGGRSVRKLLSILLLINMFFIAPPLHAVFHLWDINEVFSSEDGSVQFIEFFTTSSGQQFVASHDLISRNSDGSESNTYTFPSNSPSRTDNKHLLLATDGFGELEGGVTPDFIIPENFLFPGGGTLEFVGADTLNYPALPTDGVGSYGPTSINAENSPQNFSGESGSVMLGNGNGGGNGGGGGGMMIENPIEDRIAQGPITIELETVAEGLTSPLGVVPAADGTGRLFIYDQTGVVRVLENGTLLEPPFLQVSDRLVELETGFDERGLIGFAVHPQFDRTGLVYSYTSEPVSGEADFSTPIADGSSFNHQSVIAEWQIDPENPNQVDPGSRRELLRIDEPQFNHNGGTMRFGPDGYLYIGLGDGGGADDQGNGHSEMGNGQDTSNVYGSILRIDVNGTDSSNGQYGIPPSNPFVGSEGVDEIFAFGFRNPFMFSFDRLTSDLYVGDVGQNDIEEVDIVQKGGNYGWRIKEGSFFFDPNGGNEGFVTTEAVTTVPPDLIDPIAEYDHDDGVSVIGGFVYRGSQIPELQGRYITGDFQLGPTGRLFYLDEENTVLEFQIGIENRDLGLLLKGFGQDVHGEIYVCASGEVGPTGSAGRILKIVPVRSPVELASPARVQDSSEINVSWNGGEGPYSPQSRVEWSDQTWNTHPSTLENTTVLDPSQQGPSRFLRVQDHAVTTAQIPFTAHLSGENEEPDPVETEGAGFGKFLLEGNRLVFNIYYEGLTGPATAAHIHGPAGATENAGVMVGLGAFLVDTDGSGFLRGSVMLQEEVRRALLNRETYVNIHTEQNAPGEIRGQIAPLLWKARILGDHERPNPVETDGSGQGTFFLVGNRLGFNISYQDLSGPATDAHIHGRADAGQNAGVMLGLGPFNAPGFGVAGSLAGSAELTADQRKALIDGETYVNVHTEQHAPGEIRGQIVPSLESVGFSAWISGDMERPEPVETEGMGDASFRLDGSMLHFDIRYMGLTGEATAAHIHGPAPAGENAGVMIDLEPFNRTGFGTSGTFSGRVKLTPEQKVAVLSGRTYVNIHTEQNSPGEIRGQIAPAFLSASLSASREQPEPTMSQGHGFGLMTLVHDMLSFNATYEELTGPASDAHIHGAAGLGENAGVMIQLEPFNGANGFGVGGSLAGETGLEPAQLRAVIDRRTYVNVHTEQNPPGEIRGQITP